MQLTRKNGGNEKLILLESWRLYTNVKMKGWENSVAFFLYYLKYQTYLTIQISSLNNMTSKERKMSNMILEKVLFYCSKALAFI